MVEEDVMELVDNFSGTYRRTLDMLALLHSMVLNTPKVLFA